MLGPLNTLLKGSFFCTQVFRVFLTEELNKLWRFQSQNSE